MALITTIAPVHLEFFGSLAKIADAKAEIFLGLEADGAAVINRDIAQFARLKRRAKEAGVARIVSFGEHAKADARLVKCALHPHCSTVVAQILGTELTYKIGAPGRHLVGNSLAVLATAVLVGADLALAALALAELKPVSGRGAPIEIDLARAGRRSSSTRATTPIRRRSTPRWRCSASAKIGPHGRRIAVLGDMLELGPKGPALHRAPGQAGRRQRGRSRVLLRAADAQFVAGTSRQPSRRLCRRTPPRSKRRCCPRSAPATW